MTQDLNIKIIVVINNCIRIKKDFIKEINNNNNFISLKSVEYANMLYILSLKNN
jgi:hypothetical protein